MPNIVEIESLTLSGQDVQTYLDSLLQRSIGNLNRIVTISGSPAMDGYYSNIEGYTGLNLTASTAASARFYLDTYNNTNIFGSSFRGRRFRGTVDSPSGVLLGDVLLQLVGDGYSESGVIENASASIAFLADENFQSGKHGSHITLRTTPTGTNTQLIRLWIGQDGNVGINNFSPIYKLDVSGSGNFTQGIYWNNIPVIKSGDLVGTGLATVIWDGSKFLISGAGSAGGGEVNTASNLGNGVGVFSDKNSFDLRFYSLSAGTGINISLSGQQISINSTITGGGGLTQGELNLLYLQTGSSGAFYSSSNPSNFITSNNLLGLSSSGNVEVTGTNLQNQINSINIGTGGFIKSSNLLGLANSGNIESTGTALQNQLSNYYLKTNPEQYIKSGEVNNIFVLKTDTGNFINSNNLNGLISTGSADLRYLTTGSSGAFYASSNPSNFITSNNLNGLISTGSSDIRYLQTGVSGEFYKSTNPAGYISEGNLNGLISTGAADTRYLVTGSSGSFYLASNPNNYITSVNLNGLGTTGSFDLRYLVTGTSGQFYLASNPSNYITSTNLNGLISTGSANLTYLVTGVSGFWYPVSNPNQFIKSGDVSNQLNGFITTGNSDTRYLVTGSSGSFYRSSNPNNFSTSGNLESTGTALQNQVNTLTTNLNLTGLNSLNRDITLSGVVESSGTLLQNQINVERNKNTITGVSISGGVSITGALNISAGTNITLTQVGLNNFTITSTAAGVGASYEGVTGLSITGGIAISGAIQIVGIYGTNIVQSGNTIGISGGGGGGGSTTNNFFTITGGITGVGTNNFIPKFDSNGGLTNSNISSIGNFVGVNIPVPTEEFEVSGSLHIRNNSYNTLLGTSGNLNSYQEINVRNYSDGADASSDLVVTNDIGTDTTNYVNLGLNSSQYTGAYIGRSGDAYLYSQASGDFYIGNTNNNKSVYIFAGGTPNTEHQADIVIDTGSITFYTPNINFLRTTNARPSDSSEHSNLYMDNLAQRSILSYANNRGIGKGIQNTFALENVNVFMPNTTTSMTVIGNTAAAVGTLSHPVTFLDLTGAGYCTNFATAAAGGAGGMAGTVGPFFLTSGTTGLGAGFYYAAQFRFNDASGSYTTLTGLNTGIRFFGGMTDGATVLSTVQQPYPTQALLGFQWMRSSGVSGRVDNSFKFVTKDNGAAAPFYIQETNCEFIPQNNYAAYLYGRNDFRNGVHWMIKNLNQNTLFSGSFTGAYNTLPLVSAGAQRLLRPTIGIFSATLAVRNLKLKGMYCETV